MQQRCEWALNNADIVAFMHALRVELLVTQVMCHVADPVPGEPFQYWLRYEFGHSGNPHAHGKCYVGNNPRFDQVVKDEAMRDALRKTGRADVDDLRTWEEATRDIATFFQSYISEMHPCKDAVGRDRYDFLIENLQLKLGHFWVQKKRYFGNFKTCQN